MKVIDAILAAMCAVFLVSCSSMDTVTSAPKDSGAYEMFSADYELVKSAVLASMQNLNINIKESHQTAEGFEINFTKSISAFSWGEVGRVFVRRNDKVGTTVFVHSEKRYKPQVTGADENDFAKSIFEGVREILRSKQQ